MEVAAADWTMQNPLLEVELQDAPDGRGDAPAASEPAAEAPAPPPAAPVGEPAPDPPAKVITASELKAQIEAGVTDFEGFTIEGDVDLSGMTLKDLNFKNAIFKGKADFSSTNQSRVAPARRATRGL